MKLTAGEIQARIQGISLELADALASDGTFMKVPKGTEILREGQFVKVIPIVLSGILKVFTRNEDKELLLYYIQARESCIMSFSSALGNSPSRVFASAEEDTEALLIPTDIMRSWTSDIPEVNQLFFKQYDLRYMELLDTIRQLIFERMDQRLLDHLRQRARITGKHPIKTSHMEIARELGTAREVVSRVIKKLEREGGLQQTPDGIFLTHL
ncbi:MAG: Crp/Fnr family transcriptional regulator [Bacteroidota bacterium]|nr:Crp/Fnr family transcriptional regulator [Bacteroidota bacterium]MDX5448150.1 Crp/Fnr family transcriptional regulator [Bacteroidota bacterium]MDX5505621.1 Crp/Fnr family transcriptional regulator [Bacteroidota bacterium]